MDLSLITAAATTPVSLQELKDHLRIENTDEDAPVTLFLNAAVAEFDGRYGWLRRALVNQTWDMRIDAFPGSGIIKLPLPPLQSVTSVKYLDTNSVEQTFSSANYEVVTRDLIGFVRLNDDASWPVAEDVPGAVRVRFVAGYGSNASDVPTPIRVGILMRAAQLYFNRGDDETVPAAGVVRALMAPHRITEFENSGVLS